MSDEYEYIDITHIVKKYGPLMTQKEIENVIAMMKSLSTISCIEATMMDYYYNGHIKGSKHRDVEIACMEELLHSYAQVRVNYLKGI